MVSRGLWGFLGYGCGEECALELHSDRLFWGRRCVEINAITESVISLFGKKNNNLLSIINSFRKIDIQSLIVDSRYMSFIFEVSHE